MTTQLYCDSISFTASRDMDYDARGGVVLNVLTALPPVHRYVTGGCRGGDAFIGKWLFLRYPGAEHTVILPQKKYLIDPWWERACRPVTIIRMPSRATYAARISQLVTEAGAVVGFPSYPEDDMRSAGSRTWQTIRVTDPHA